MTGWKACCWLWTCHCEISRRDPAGRSGPPYMLCLLTLRRNMPSVAMVLRLGVLPSSEMADTLQSVELDNSMTVLPVFANPAGGGDAGDLRSPGRAVRRLRRP